MKPTLRSSCVTGDTAEPGRQEKEMKEREREAFVTLDHLPATRRLRIEKCSEEEEEAAAIYHGKTPVHTAEDPPDTYLQTQHTQNIQKSRELLSHSKPTNQHNI